MNRSAAVADVMIAELADREAALLAYSEALEADAAGYQLVARQCLTALHDNQIACDRLRDRYRRLEAEYRQLREQVMRDAAGA